MEGLYNEVRTYIRLGKLASIQQLVEDLLEAKQEKEYRYNFEWLWQKAYLCACIHAKKSSEHAQIKEYLYECYCMLDPITQMALKPTLLYGKYL